MFTRRNLIISSLATASGISPAWSQSAWPSRPVRLVVPFAAGGGADIAARLLADGLQRVWNGTPAIVENRGGGNTIIAVRAALSAPRDGYMFLVTISLSVQLPFMMESVPFSPATDLVPIKPVTTEQLVLVVRANGGVKSLPDLIEAAKTDPTKYAYGSYGVGSISHLFYLALAKATGLEIVHVPYRGTGPAFQGLLAGDIGLMLSNLGTVKSHIASGTVTPLAVTGDSPSKFLPSVPTLAQLGFAGFDVPAWIGMFATVGTPSAIISKMGEDMQKALAFPDIVARFSDVGQEPGQGSAQDFQALIAKDNANNEPLIRAANIRLD
jgi:tripartite-type tricarboxylate transporter receptor subunit TctC